MSGTERPDSSRREPGGRAGRTEDRSSGCNGDMHKAPAGVHVTAVDLPRLDVVDGLVSCLEQRGLSVERLSPQSGEDAPEEADRLLRADDKEQRAVLLGVQGAPGRALLAELARQQRTTVVAILPSADPQELAQCVADGAAGAIGAGYSVEQALTVFDQAVNGVICLPATVVSEAIQSARTQTGSPELSEEQVELLKALTDGVTVGDLARTTHRSRRTMTRILRKLYDSIGVGNRRQAVEWATEKGVLAGPASTEVAS